MTRLLGVLVLIVVAVVGLGFYLDWFHVSTEDTKGKTDINISVDKDKIQEDKEKAKEKLEEAGSKVKEKLNDK